MKNRSIFVILLCLLSISFATSYNNLGLIVETYKDSSLEVKKDVYKKEFDNLTYGKYRATKLINLLIAHNEFDVLLFLESVIKTEYLRKNLMSDVLRKNSEDVVKNVLRIWAIKYKDGCVHRNSLYKHTEVLRHYYRKDLDFILKVAENKQYETSVRYMALNIISQHNLKEYLPRIARLCEDTTVIRKKCSSCRKLTLGEYAKGVYLIMTKGGTPLKYMDSENLRVYGGFECLYKEYH